MKMTDPEYEISVECWIPVDYRVPYAVAFLKVA